MPATHAIDAYGSTVSNIEDDETLVVRARSDSDVFALLYRKYVADVYRYCLYRLHDREAAEDVTSQVFLNAYRSFATLGDRPFRPWLFSIAHNAVVDVHRRAVPQSAPLDGVVDWADPAETPESAVIRGEIRELVLDLLSQLPQRDRAVIELRLAGLDGSEIAAALQCSPGAVRTAHHRAMERLRTLMATPDDGSIRGRHDGSE